MSSSAPLGTTIRRAGAEDAAMLAELGASTFIETFAADNRPDDMAVYLEGAFGEEIQRGELADRAVTVFLAERAGAVVGYLMLREGAVWPGLADTAPIEIARLYVRRSALGGGVGAALMRRAIDEAVARGKDAIWLGVWERNARALEFYRRWGFVEAGSQPFTLGRDRQNDLIMVRRTAREV